MVRVEGADSRLGVRRHAEKRCGVYAGEPAFRSQRGGRRLRVGTGNTSGAAPDWARPVAGAAVPVVRAGRLPGRRERRHFLVKLPELLPVAGPGGIRRTHPDAGRQGARRVLPPEYHHDAAPEPKRPPPDRRITSRKAPPTLHRGECAGEPSRARIAGK